MNWVNNSLQLAGTILESVDQRAALTLSGDDSEDTVNLLSSIKNGLTNTLTKESAQDQHVQADENEEEDELSNDVVVTTASTAVNDTAKLSLQEECNRLRKESTRLKSELRTKEKALVTKQQSIKVYEDEMEALERECTVKLAQMQQQLTQLKVEKESEEHQFVRALQLKDQQLETVQRETKAMEEVQARQVTEIQQLREEIERAEHSKDTMWTNATSATEESQQVIQSLRTELQEALTSLSNAKREYSETKMTMFTRQAQLEKTNAELSNTVAALGRDLTKQKELHSRCGSEQNIAADMESSHLQENYRRVQQALVVTKKALHDESQRCEVQRQEVVSLTAEVKRLQEILSTTQDEASTSIMALSKANAELKDKLSRELSPSLSSPSSITTTQQESEIRIQTLTNRMIEKQEIIDGLRSKITTLEVRLSEAQTQTIRAEEKLCQIERNGGIPVDMELGGATPVGSRRGGGASGLRARTNRISSTISRVAPVLERSTRVISIIDMLDRWLLLLGRMFLSYPLARLIMLGYVLLIHLWVFVVISFHTSHLNEEIHGDGGGGIVAPNDLGLFPDGMQVPP